jgi:hypothetical protein
VRQPTSLNESKECLTWLGVGPIWVGAVGSVQRLSQSFVVFDSKDANVGPRTPTHWPPCRQHHSLSLVVLRLADVLNACLSCGGERRPPTGWLAGGGRLVGGGNPYNNLMSPHPDVLIIGGGVIGLTVAYYLAREGVAVTVADKGEMGQEASWAGAGIIPPGNPERTWCRESRTVNLPVHGWPATWTVGLIRQFPITPHVPPIPPLRRGRAAAVRGG